jgi:DNA repair exonuclease SbcCD nuclease subunit
MDSVIILGDIHLGKNAGLGKNTIGAGMNSRIEDQLNLLDWTLERAIEHSSAHIIVTGDVFEEPKPHPALITAFISWLKKCQAHNIHTHIIIGNHDILRNGFVYSSPLDIVSEMDIDCISVYKQIDTILIGGTAFTMVPFRDRKSFACKSNAEALSILKETLVYEVSGAPVTYKKVLVGHLAIEDSIPVGDEIDDMTNELFCPKNMFSGYDYVWMGHVHKPQIMQKRNPYIAHIGSMDISNFGETDQKKHIVIFNCDSIDNDFEIEYLPTRALKKISISIPKDTKDTTQFVLDKIASFTDIDKSIVKVDVTLEEPELNSINKSMIDKALIKAGVFSVSGISESKKTISLKKDANNTLDSKMDVVPAIKIYAKNQIKDEQRTPFIDLAVSIYNKFKLENKE